MTDTIPDLKVVRTMARDHGLSALNYMIQCLGWDREDAIQWLQKAAKAEMALDIATGHNR